MVAHALVALVVLAALERVHLGGAGLASRAVRRAGKGARARAETGDVFQRLPHLGDIFWLDVDFRDQLGRKFLALALVVDHRPQHVRTHALAVIGDGRHRLRHLKRGVGVVPLADAHRDRLAGIPLLLFPGLEAFAFPVRRRQHAFPFSRQVDPGARAEAELGHETGDPFDLQVAGQHVVVGVARHHQGLVHVDRAMAALLVVHELMPAEPEKAGIGDFLLPFALFVGQPGQGHERLESRAGRIGAVDGAVEQRLVEFVLRDADFVQHSPVRAGDAVDEQIGIESRHRHQGEHFAVRRIERHQGATAIAESGFGDFLQFEVDAQLDVVARRRGVALQAPHGPAAGIDLDVLDPGGAMEIDLVGRFHAALADVFGATVVGGIAAFVEALLLLVVDAADVAHQVRSQRPVRVIAEQPRLHFDAREAVTLPDEARDLLVAEMGADRRAVQAAVFRAEFFEAPFVALVDGDEPGELVDYPGEGLVFFRIDDVRGNLQRIGGEIARQHGAVAIDDVAALRHDRQRGDAVVLGERVVMLVVLHLEDVEPQNQQDAAGEHEGGRGDQTQEKTSRALVGVGEGFHPTPSDWPIFIPIDRLELRQQQKIGERQPERHADEAGKKVFPSREFFLGKHPYPDHQCLGDQQHRQHVQGLQQGRKPHHPPGQGVGHESEHHIGKGMLPHWPAAADIDEQAKGEAHAHADVQRFADAPERQHQRHPVRQHAGKIAGGDVIQHEGDEQAQIDEPRLRRLQDAIGTVGELHGRIA